MILNRPCAGRRLTGIGLLSLLFVLVFMAGLGTSLWMERNPLPDGYQNEYLHIGNALDLWGAFQARDLYHVLHYLRNSYWPPLFYVLPWPLLTALGSSRESLVLSNLFWYAICVVGLFGLASSRRAGLLSVLIFSLCPGLFGCMTRFEPNVANHAWVALSLLALDRSRSLSRPRYAILFGLCLALGLLTDRLGTLPFVVGPLLLLLRPEGAIAGGSSGLWRQARALPWRGLGLVTIVVLLLASPWYLVWAHAQVAEITSQLAVGEIDSAGALTEPLDAPSWSRPLYYLLVLVDSQAGPLLGVAMLVSLLWKPRRSLLLSVVVAWLLFSLVQKKQVFYTLPVLVPLSVILAEALLKTRALAPSLSFLLLAAGLHQLAGRMWGSAWPVARTLSAQDPLPEAWVRPRHILARPPQDPGAPLPEIVGSLAALSRRKPSGVVLFSDSPSFFEGYLELRLREILPRDRVRSLRQDPHGTYEWFRASTAFLVVSEAPLAGWPDATRLEAALLQDHYDLSALPPLPALVSRESALWSELRRWRSAEGVSFVLFVRD